jgi:hypothetical protein
VIGMDYQREGGEEIPRLGIERRCFSYAAYVPERRSGFDRRNLLPSLRVCKKE